MGNPNIVNAGIASGINASDRVRDFRDFCLKNIHRKIEFGEVAPWIFISTILHASDNAIEGDLSKLLGKSGDAKFDILNRRQLLPVLDDKEAALLFEGMQKTG